MTMMSPEEAAKPALRIRERFLASSWAMTAPKSRAISSVRSVQRLRTTMVSTSCGVNLEASATAARPIGRYSSSLWVGMMTEIFMGC